MVLSDSWSHIYIKVNQQNTMATASYYKNDDKCSLCAKKDIDRIANHFCSNCKKKLCKTCLRNHDRLYEKHEIIRLNEKQKIEQRKRGERDELTEKREKHTDKWITQCQSHDQRPWTDADHIKKPARKLSADPDLQAAPVQLPSVLDIIKTAIKALDNNVASIQKEGSGFLQDLEDYAVKLLSRIKELRENDHKTIRSHQVVRKIDVRIPKDETICVIYGCCRLCNGSLVIADFENSRLKLVDPSSEKVTKHMDTVEKPTDVCCLGPEEVAVAFRSTQVHVYSTESLAYTRTIKLGHSTYKMACHGDLLYAGENNTLYKYDLGERRKQIWQIYKDTDRQDLFSDIQGIAVNSPGDRIYVADWKKGLICVNKDGQQIFRLSLGDLNLSGVQAVTTDDRGHVFVCGGRSDNVVEVKENGQVVGQILAPKDGLIGPRCIAYDVDRSRFYVGGYSFFCSDLC